MDYPIISGGLNWQTLETLAGQFAKHLLSHGMRVAEQTETMVVESASVATNTVHTPHNPTALVLVAVFGLGLLFGIAIGAYYKSWDAKSSE